MKVRNLFFLFLMAGSCLVTNCKKNNPNSDKPVYRECLDFERLPENGWIVDLTARLRPVRITKYAFRTDGWAYLFSGDKAVLYDCQGTLICESKEPDAKDCLQLVELGAKGQVIFEKP